MINKTIMLRLTKLCSMHHENKQIVRLWADLQKRYKSGRLELTPKKLVVDREIYLMLSVQSSLKTKKSCQKIKAMNSRPTAQVHTNSAYFCDSLSSAIVPYRTVLLCKYLWWSMGLMDYFIDMIRHFPASSVTLDTQLTFPTYSYVTQFRTNITGELPIGK